MNENNKKVLYNKEVIRQSTDAMTDLIDERAIENIKALQAQVNYREELVSSLRKLDAHSICPGSLPTCEDANNSYNLDYLSHTEQSAPSYQQPQESPQVHGEDCHCSKCCPNPNPNFLQKHKVSILIFVLWIIMILLGVGWTPSGGIVDAINSSWVELVVNVFKIGMFAIAGIVTYNLVKKGDA